eukprot:TRINITY_DN3009_c0_g1_i1.p1 TRINITY_DN3009_c0_g1~~TRINITY_DN3009_c0_g1_i1.p1  ORF type:complete len:415 (+),score=37.00 TRINITY_DN3009_c0_g1_i1:246-1490(+)
MSAIPSLVVFNAVFEGILIPLVLTVPALRCYFYTSPSSTALLPTSTSHHAPSTSAYTDLATSCLSSDAAGYFALVHARVLFLFGFFTIFITFFLASSRSHSDTDCLKSVARSTTAHFSSLLRSSTLLSTTPGDALLLMLWGLYHLTTAWSWIPSDWTSSTGGGQSTYQHVYQVPLKSAPMATSYWLLGIHSVLGFLFVAAGLPILWTRIVSYTTRFYYSEKHLSDATINDCPPPSTEQKPKLEPSVTWQQPSQKYQKSSNWFDRYFVYENFRSLRHTLAQSLFILNGLGQLYGAYQLAFEHEQMFVWRGESYRVEWIQRFVVPMATFAFGSVLYGIIVPTTVGIATTKIPNAGQQRQTEDICKAAFGVVWLLYHLLAIPDAFFMGLHSATTAAFVHAGLAGAFLFYLRSIKLVV